MEANTQIEHSAAQAVKVIAAAAEQATKTIASAAAEAARVRRIADGNDHDTIVEIKTMQGVMLAELREIKSDSASRIACLENEKLDIKDSYSDVYRKGVEERLIDHEKRILNLSTTNTRLLVLLTIGTGILSLLTTLLIFHLVGN